MKFSKVKILAGAMLMAMTAACSTHQPKSDEQVVESLSLQRLELLQELDFEAAYELMSPGYRQTRDLDRFKFDFGGAGTIRSFKFKSASCEEDQCSTYVDVEYDLGANAPGLKIVRTNIESWIRVDGKWWFVKSE